MRLCTWLNQDIFLNWDQFPTVLAALVFSAEPVVKILWALPVFICTLVAHCSSCPGWGFVVLRGTANIDGKSVQGRSEIPQTLLHLLL